jgi:eukaryotic-like serine/threonine-protein kinase
MSAHLEKTPVPPIEIDKGISPVLNELIVLSLNRDPACRFQSAAAFRNALSSLQPESPKTAPASVPPEAASAKPQSRRWLWVAAGGLAAVLAIVAIIQFGPRTKINASPPAQPASQQAASPPPTAAPAQPAPSTPAPAPAVQPIATPAVETAPAPVPSHKAEKQHIKPLSPPVQTTPATRPVDTPTPTQALQPAPAAPPPAQAAPAQPPAASQAELEPLRDQYTQLDARAESIRGTLVNLQRSQAAQGLSLRGDWTQAATLMDSYLRQADSALGAEDAAPAKASLKKAERQIEFLEKALNK